MLNRLVILIAASLLASATLEAQQSQSTTPAQAQAKSAPCVPSSVIPKRVHIGVPPLFQKQLDKLAIRLGTNIDVQGTINDATKPHPCPTVTASPQPPVLTKPTILPSHPPVTIECYVFTEAPKESVDRSPVGTLPDPHKFAVPTRANEVEVDDVSPGLGGTVPCNSIRTDPVTHRYWSTASKPESEPIVNSKQPTPKQ